MMKTMNNARTIMKFLRTTIASLLLLAAATTADAQPFAYITDGSNDKISVINTATNTVVTTFALAPGSGPSGVAFTPDGTRVYVTNEIRKSTRLNSSHG